MKKEKKRIIQNSGSSNLLVNRMWSIAVSRIRVFVLSLLDEFPKRSVLVRSFKKFEIFVG